MEPFQRLFFHNQHSVESHNILSTLEPDITVYDVFGSDSSSLLPNIKLSTIPYLIDKYITLETTSPYTVGLISLQFYCRDHLGTQLINCNDFFHIIVNGDYYDHSAINGVIEIQFECSSPMKIDIGIEGYTGFMPFSTTIEVK